MKRACLIHGLGGTPTEGWIHWLQRKLRAQGYEVYAPQMPAPFTPDMQAWQQTIARHVGTVDEQTFFVGHSLGCLAILHYLESLPSTQRAGGAVFVGGTLTLPDVPVQKIARVVQPWFERKKNFEKIRERVRKIVAILSDDDPLIPAVQLDAFALRLGAETVLEHGRGHYTWLEGVSEAPTVLEHLERISRRPARRRRAIETKRRTTCTKF